MTLDALCESLDAAGVAVTVDGGRLKVAGPRGALSPELWQAISDHKPALIAVLTGYQPLDEVIAASEADRRPLKEIETRLQRLEERAAAPDATELERAVADDWQRIRAAKLSERQAA